MTDSSISTINSVMFSPTYIQHESRVIVVGDRKADIDLGLTALIRRLWAKDIDTLFCCEGYDVPEGDDHNSWSYLTFRGYITMVANPRSAYLIARIVENFLTTKKDHSWDIEFHKSGFQGNVITIRFPKKDISNLTSFVEVIL